MIGGFCENSPSQYTPRSGARDRPEELGDRRGGQQALGSELLAREHLEEVTGEDLDRADEQSRSTGPVGQLPQLFKIEVLIEDVAELFPLPMSGGGMG